MSSARRSRLRQYWRNYIDEAPHVAANLTTAAILFVIAVIFQPAIQRLLSPPAPTYPISCSADPVFVDMATGRTLSSFFIVNRADEALDAGQLVKHLTAAMGDQATPADTAIILRYGGYNGKFLRAREDQDFNGDKGKIDVSFSNDTIRMNIKNIEAAAILKVDIEALQSPPPPKSILSRDMKDTLPFKRDYEKTCYRG